MLHKNNLSVIFGVIILFMNTVLLTAFIPHRFGLDGVFVGTTLWMIGSLAVLGIVLDQSPLNFSLNIMHWFFVLLQFFYVPLFQISEGLYPWNFILSVEEIIRTNLIILTWCIVYFLTYVFLSNRKRDIWKVAIDYGDLSVTKALSDRTIFIMFIISSIIFIYSVMRYGGTLVGSRDALSTSVGVDGRQFSLFYYTTVRFVAPLTLAFYLMNNKIRRRAKKFNILVLFLLVYVMVLYFPTNSGRTWSFVIYVGLYITNFFRVRHKWSLPVVMILAFVWLAPVLNVFRHNELEYDRLIQAFQYEFDPNSILVNGDYDCYINTAIVSRYVEENGICWGKQLLGCLLFFVPRSIWPTKPIGTGCMVFAEQSYNFTNVSCPLVAESFINFGIFGVLFFSFVYSSLCCVLDMNACRFRDNTSDNVTFNSLAHYSQYAYWFIVGFSYLLNRGDLMSSFSFFVGIMFPLFVLSFFSPPNTLRMHGR